MPRRARQDDAARLPTAEAIALGSVIDETPIGLRIVKAARSRGFERTLQSVLDLPYDHWFEVKTGTRTGGQLAVDGLDTVGNSLASAHRYQPVRTLHLRRALDRVPKSDRGVLVDYGAGLGRVLIVANLLGYRASVGVEFARELCETANENLDSYCAKSGTSRESLTVIHADAASYEPTVDQTVFYFYNPFSNEVLGDVLDQIMHSVAREPRRIWLLFAGEMAEESALERGCELKFIETWGGMVTRGFARESSPTPASSQPATRHVGDVEWDAFVRDVGGELTQRCGWARSKGSAYSASTIGLGPDHELHAGTMLLHRRVGPRVRVGYISGGPLCKIDHPELVDRMVHALVEEARRLRLFAVFVTPRPGDDEVAASLAHNGFEISHLSVSPPATVLVDLNQPLEEIFAKLRKSRRRAIRRAQAQGVVIREGDRADLKVLHALHECSARAHDFQPQPLQYFQRQWDEFNDGGFVRSFFAEVDGEALAADFIVASGGTVIDKLGGWADSELARRTQPNALMQWHLISWAKQSGFRWYDMGGLSRDIAEQILAGTATPDDFSQHHDYFKLGFGGEVVSLPPTFVYCPVPGGQSVIRTLGRLADRPGFFNRRLNRLRS